MALAPAAYEATITGVPLWRLRQYLEDIGAVSQADGWLAAAGWRARLTQVEDYAIGSVRVGRVRLEFRGDASAVQAARAALAPRLARGGG